MIRQRGFTWGRSAASFGLGLALCLSLTAQAAVPNPSSAPAYDASAPAVSQPLTVGETADIALARGEYNTAIALLHPLLKDKHFPRVLRASYYNRTGIADEQLQNLKQARNDFDQARKLDKTKARYVNNLGTVYYVQRNYKQARKFFSQAVKIEPGQATFWVNLGGAEFGLKHVPEAISDYRTALMLDPNSLFPQGGTGPLVRDANGTDSGLYHYALARLFCTLGMIDDAVNEFSQAYDMHYAKLKDSLTDPAFAPLRKRQEYRLMMGLAPDTPEEEGTAPATPAGSAQ